MKILIIGNGAREHALAWKAAQSSKVDEVFVAPGNAGTALETKVRNVDINVTQINELVSFAKKEGIDLTIVGPEAALVAGVVDAFQAAHLNCFGPTKAAVQLESSKAFSKEFMKRHHIPTATHATFTDPEAAKAYIRKQGTPIVIKADGLAGGKGVVVARTEQEALDAIDQMLVEHAFGEAGAQVVIEQFLAGEEVSFIVMSDGKFILPLATSQDHKTRDNGDRGPNTGGMGAYSPAPVVTPSIHKHIMETVIKPTIVGMAQEGHPYVGFLYAGLMIDKDGSFNVLEYNCRFGDPETQPILLRLKSDLILLCEAALEQRLDKVIIEWDKRAALAVVLTAGGYPNQYRQGDIIEGLSSTHFPDTKIFHGGTKQEDQNIVTAGGRVLSITALGNDIASAQHKAYDVAKRIHWPDIHYRTDIGYRALSRKNFHD